MAYCGFETGTTADVRAANLVLADEAAQAGYSSAEPQQPYGIGNRMLDDRYASQPLGGEIEAMTASKVHFWKPCGVGFANHAMAVPHQLDRDDRLKKLSAATMLD
eukprot:6477254-Amphidinium_carterae.3